LYTTVMSGGAAVSALVAVPIAVALGGWRPALAVWLLLVVIAFLVWLPQLRGSSQHVAVARSTLGTGLWRRPLAWAVAMYFGLQSLSFYALLNWLPSFLRDNGFSPTSAGALLSLMTIVGVPFGLLVPSIAGRRPNQRLAVAITTFVSALGLLGLAVLPRSAPVLWVTLIGLGMGATFPLALTLVALRSSNPAVTGELSAMVQGFGYLIAAAGTFFVGFLHDLTHGWGTVVLLLLILTAVQGAAGWIGGRDALVA
jgi:CP family cyanate transporter-like MFS transporter